MTATLPVVRPQVGIYLSIGEPPAGERIYPRKLDHFRPKPGAEGQFAGAVENFNAAYPDDPKVLDIILLSDSVDAALDLRYKAWGTSGLKAVGTTNFALCPERMGEPDLCVIFPDEAPETREGELRPFTMPTTKAEIDAVDPADGYAAKIGLRLYGVFRFALPKVTGLTMLAEISTTSRKSMLNLLSGLTTAHTFTGGRLAGIPFQLAVRPARTRYFDQKARKRKTSTFYELVFQTPYAFDEFFRLVNQRRALMGGQPPLELPPVAHDDRERDREVAPGLWADSPEREVEDFTDVDTPLDEGPLAGEIVEPESQPDGGSESEPPTDSSGSADEAGAEGDAVLSADQPDGDQEESLFQQPASVRMDPEAAA